MEDSVTVIDVGSNSIKLLVAARGSPVTTIATDIREVRISAGMYGEPPRLAETAMEAGVAAITELLQSQHSAQQGVVIIVATSAVREATNGSQFAARVKEATGVGLRVLDGNEEARSICRGVLCDPSLFGLNTFRLIDIGGGSLEVVLYQDGEVISACSLPLGAVRLTERFVADPTLPVTQPHLESIADEVLHQLKTEAVNLAEPETPLICSGGAFRVIRDLIGPRCPKLHVRDMIHWRDRLATMTLEERKAIPGMPPERADIMVPALQIMITLAEQSGADALLNTRFNLRYGIASEWFENHQ